MLRSWSYFGQLRAFGTPPDPAGDSPRKIFSSTATKSLKKAKKVDIRNVRLWLQAKSPSPGGSSFGWGLSAQNFFVISLQIVKKSQKKSILGKSGSGFRQKARLQAALASAPQHCSAKEFGRNSSMWRISMDASSKSYVSMWVCVVFKDWVNLELESLVRLLSSSDIVVHDEMVIYTSVQVRYY